MFSTAPFLAAAEPDYGPLNAILKKYVQRGTRSGISANLVDYKGLALDANWKAAQKNISEFPTKNLKTRREKMAFYINAYNVAALGKVLEQYPTSSIKAKGDGVWKEPAISIDGKQLSLDAIENNILRPLKEPRIHFAIVCASLSCPDLRKEAYTARKLSHQLAQQTASFLNNKSKGLRIEGDKVSDSAIFHWFAADFGNVHEFQKKYVKSLPKSTPIEIPYNWALNGK